MGKNWNIFCAILKSPSKSENQLLGILKMKFVLIAFLLTVLVSCSMAQQSWGEKHLMRSGRDLKVLEEVRDLDAGAEISLNNQEKRDGGGMGVGCSNSYCKSKRDCKGRGKYSRCAEGKCCTEYQ